MQEEWRQVAGYEGLYTVSNQGKVYSVPRRDSGNVSRGGFLLKHQKDRYGYEYVILSKNGVRKHEKVHRLVGAAFCDGYSPEKEINHIDENKSNNAADNLEWVTPGQNVNHGTRNSRVADKQRKLKRRIVQQLETDGTLVAEYDNGAIAARETGIQHTHIIACCNGRAKTAGGYRWKYKD